MKKKKEIVLYTFLKIQCDSCNNEQEIKVLNDNKHNQQICPTCNNLVVSEIIFNKGCFKWE